TITTNRPLTKAALLHLGEHWPQSIHFNELLEKARMRLDKAQPQNTDDSEADGKTLGEILLKLYAGALVELHVCPPRFALELSERRVVSALARLQSREDTVVTNLRHTGIKIEDEPARYLVQLLDGSRDRTALFNELADMVKTNGGTLQKDGRQISEAAEISRIINEGMDKNLAELARLALIVA